MIVCVCRNIDDAEYTREELKELILASDFRCGQCQLYYELGMDENQENKE